MLLYIMMAIFPLILSHFYSELDSDNRQKRDYLIFVGIVLFCFLAFRSEFVGSKDTYNYANMMRNAINSDTWKEFYNSDGVEKGFQFFNFVLSRIFSDPQWIIIVTSSIYVVSICYFIYKNSDDAALSVFMFITLGMMTFQMQGMRQAIAMSICLLAYEFAKQQKLIKFILTVFFAMLFHQTAVVFFVIYFLIRFKYSTQNIMLLLVASVIIIFSAEKIITLANDWFDMGYTKSVESGGYVATAVHILIIVFALLLNEDFNLIKIKSTISDISVSQKTQIQINMLYISILGAVCYILRYFGSLQAERISFYFLFSQLILFPNTIYGIKRTEAPLIRLISIILIIALFAYRLHDSDLVPFNFCWQEI